MRTSSFSKVYTFKGFDFVSIAAKAPADFKGRQYKKLAPSWQIFKKYKKDRDEQAYTKEYLKILDRLDPQTVLDELGEDAVLLCYERPGEFCHRQLVALWLEAELGITIEELR